MRSVEIEGTRQENASASFSEIAVPEKPDVKLFVQCLKSEGACSVAYRTAAWGEDGGDSVWGIVDLPRIEHT